MGAGTNGTDLAVFSPSRFITDCKNLAELINAPYSEAMVRKVIEAYHQYFQDFPVLWRTNGPEGEALNFRFYSFASTTARVLDVTAIAVAAGLLKEDNALSPLIASWSALYDDTTEMCDFDAEKGLAKTWVYFGGNRLLDDVLRPSEVPESIRRHAAAFKAVGLHEVRFTCVDYASETVNIYFKVTGVISDERAAQLVALAGCPPPSEQDTQEMRKWLNPRDIPFAVTIAVATGKIKRVAFYAMKLPDGELPKLGDRLVQFFKHAPCYDRMEMNAVGWSFGNGGSSYIKAERTYCGDLLRHLKEWRLKVIS